MAPAVDPGIRAAAVKRNQHHRRTIISIISPTHFTKDLFAYFPALLFDVSLFGSQGMNSFDWVLRPPVHPAKSKRRVRR